jgi:hypothetical protein
MNAQHTRKAALNQLEEEISQSAFDCWAMDTHGVSCEDELFTDAARDILTRDWLKGHPTLTAESVLRRNYDLPAEFLHILMELERTRSTLRLWEYPGWTLIPTKLLERYGLIVGAVAGKIWSYSQMGDWNSQATVPGLARDLKLPESAVHDAILILIVHGYVKTAKAAFRTKSRVYKGTARMRSFGTERTIKKTPQWDSTTDFDPWQ